MSKLSAIDAVWLNAEKEDGAPIAIGALVELDGPAPSLAEIRDFLRDRMALTDRLRQRVVPPSPRRMQVSWEDAEPDFDHHVREIVLAEGADQAALERAVADVMGIQMDRSRPLWDYTLITGLAEDRWAVISRVHHAVADGQGALLLTGRLIDIDPEGTTSLTAAVEAMSAAGVPSDADGTPKPDAKALVAEATKRGGDLVVRALRTVRSASATTEALKSVSDSAVKQAQTIGTQLPRSAGLLAGDPGQDRDWHVATVDFSDIKAIRRGLGGTVNDVVMTLMSGGYRAVLTEWGTDPEGATVRVLVPVSLRGPGDLSANNQVGGLMVVLPLGDTTLARYADIRAHLNAVKNLGTAPLASPAYDFIDRTVPAIVQTFAVSTVGGVLAGTFVESVVTNVPGPQFPLYVAGRQARTMVPIIPLGEPLRLSVGVMSYNGVVYFGISGGEGIGDAVHQVATGVQSALKDLLAAAGSTNP